MSLYRFFIVLTLFIASCAAPLATKDEASKYLQGSCLQLFLNGNSTGYQHVVNRPFNNEAVFAMAISNDGRQKCAMARNLHEINTYGLTGDFKGENLYAALETVAIARCESLNAGENFSRCKIFARQNNIVWSKESENFKPQMQ